MRPSNGTAATEPPAYKHSTHHVHRGPESLPCYCEATADHAIGSELTAAPAQPEAPSVECWRQAMNEYADLPWGIRISLGKDGIDWVERRAFTIAAAPAPPK